MSVASRFGDIFNLFSPGYAVPHSDAGFIAHLSNPLFRKIIAFADQAVFIVNHTTFQYEFVSDNVKNICGFNAADFKAEGLDFTFQRMHPDDVTLLQTVMTTRPRTILSCSKLIGIEC